jgi:hypothetical protein
MSDRSRGGSPVLVRPSERRRVHHKGAHAQPPGLGGHRLRVQVTTGAAVALSAALAVAVVVYERGSGIALPHGASAMAVTRLPKPPTTVLAVPADLAADDLASTVFASAPVAVVANASSRADIAKAATSAERAHVPLLLVTRTASRAVAALRGTVRSLDTHAVVDFGVAAGFLRARLPRVLVTTRLTALALAARAPAPLRRVVLLEHAHDNTAGATAAAATALAAGARVIDVTGWDPRTDPAAIKALAAAKPAHVIAIGMRFGPARLLAARLAVAETGVQLPAGGQLLFPAHRLLALYGHPGAPALGALGQQDLNASIARIRAIAASYKRLSSVPVVPAFEIIATVAQASPGPDGSYSYESPVSALWPWVRRATAAGMYVILDLQPGRSSLLAQAKRYTRMLALPDVGLAIDPEWKLRPGQRPLRQIGSVSTAEINGVIRWLAGLTARLHLPQKLLVLHQFELSMIAGEQRLDTGHDDLAIVIHMDGQGTPSDKLRTWQAVTGAAPAGVFFGWKNFLVKDHPMLSPAQTMSNRPQPVMISYQ